ncbi:MAG: sigma-54-dependent Fis family transcriptional regulator [Candidatus Brocadia sp. AMX2]|uniref:Sigma 54 response regulator n=1 Tax=Candidatus Brocadia sinica JPN1 TaxID=1197129 RepID=A0ABQ0JU98_9BACT|nr:MULTISPECIES: sigma-54 dependent transcriptional regulator [Brocadia]MBC6934102.1 sigma-54-dependent Fis family transcriptional regulator [Candidatus Brocadia sp.]MBL1170716.1 sigma-54-dependent Fis family transcriptional regulator [Candidatus Brocadia sp. AMX1]NOG41824.1 sigma-54-dependent Fis family transcriptional regulator [Planctomycetota bacterium]GIK14162.1 MAG: acetoacetate metabolism regulatory protein AtoC [Candidatus Brocadia sinica]KAA0241310.1 MAG: sigma-54-dependent Fis family
MKSKILIVDDEKLMRVSLEDKLVKEGYAVACLSNAIEGLKVLQSTNFDAVITDVRLPKIDGIEFLKEIKKLSPDTIVIIMTAYGSIENAVLAMKEGAYDYVTKPFSLEELLIKLRKALKHKDVVAENILLKQQVLSQYGYDNMIGKSDAMKHVFEIINTVSNRDTTILIQGESGTGKELTAGAIHYNSNRRNGPFIKLSCASLNKEILESELFGHEKGSFTGAIKTRRGRFELADGGTIFLDDVDDIPLEMQVKLLRVLQEREFERVGGEETIPVNVRVICATKKDLKKLVQEGRFREDLYYRLHVVTLHLPPLRERKEDIPLLVNYFMKKYAAQQRVVINSISQEALHLLLLYNWPGNIRELENAVEHAVAFCTSGAILSKNLPQNLTQGETSSGIFPVELSTIDSLDLQETLSEAERKLLLWAYQKTNGNQVRMSEILRIPRTTLQNKLVKYNITKTHIPATEQT